MFASPSSGPRGSGYFPTNHDRPQGAGAGQAAWGGDRLGVFRTLHSTPSRHCLLQAPPGGEECGALPSPVPPLAGVPEPAGRALQWLGKWGGRDRVAPGEAVGRGAGVSGEGGAGGPLHVLLGGGRCGARMETNMNKQADPISLQVAKNTLFGLKPNMSFASH